MPQLVVSARTLMARRYMPTTRATNCLEHAHIPIYDRNVSLCTLCAADVKNALSQLNGLNEWLNGWRDDALDVLTRQEAALALLQGYEAREHVDGHHSPLADVVRDVDLEGRKQVLLAELTPRQAETLDLFLHQVLDTAEGIVSFINVNEGGGTQDGSR